MIEELSPQAIQALGQIRLASLKITNFRALDKLEIEFPRPLLKTDSDIFVLGSKNGQGKTSVLQACSLLLIAALIGEKNFYTLLEKSLRHYSGSVDFADLFIRAGADKATLEGKFSVGSSFIEVNLSWLKSGLPHIKIENELSANHLEFDLLEIGEKLFSTLLGFNPNPFILSPLIYFHSYRKVQEGSFEIGSMLEERPHSLSYYQNSQYTTLSTLKQQVLLSIMSQQNVFGKLKVDEAAEVVGTFRNLLRRYAKVELANPELLPHNRVQLRVNVEAGEYSIPFDSLGSGQKEIISTLFLIWYYTRKQPSLVLIDEPELHLNAEWHRQFVHDLERIAPNNQYIIATHSGDIASAVEGSHRMILVSNNKANV